jgi:hypothetical protein
LKKASKEKSAEEEEEESTQCQWDKTEKVLQ